MTGLLICLFNRPYWPFLLRVYTLGVILLRQQPLTFLLLVTFINLLVADPTEAPLIIQILKGYRQLTPLNDVSLPITLPVLQNLIRAFERSLSSHYQSCLMSAMCALAFSLFSALLS